MQSAQRNTQLLTQALGLGFTFGVILPYSRKHELQSDLLGAKYMHKAGYDANQAVRLWEKMAESSTSRQPEFMSTHPDPDKRAQKLRDYIAYQERLGSQGWESIKMPKSS
jgi:predicted Zn-dependent protease